MSNKNTLVFKIKAIVKYLISKADLKKLSCLIVILAYFFILIIFTLSPPVVINSSSLLKNFEESYVIR